jgi:hypothetical protein
MTGVDAVRNRVLCGFASLLVGAFCASTGAAVSTPFGGGGNQP